MTIIVAVLFGSAALIATIAIALGWVADTTQPVRRWYPAAPDPEPCPFDGR